MTINISNFGDILISRPAGRDAFLGACAYILDGAASEKEFVLDFADVKVLTPSWADEFITGLKNKFAAKITYANTQNESVSASLEAIA